MIVSVKIQFKKGRRHAKHLGPVPMPVSVSASVPGLVPAPAPVPAPVPVPLQKLANRIAVFSRPHI